MRLKYFLLMFLFLFGGGCSEIVVKPVEDTYHLNDRSAFYKLKKWTFKGRLAVSDNKESWTASIEWVHTEKKETLQLSGPLGQSAIKIILTENSVILDRGDGKVLQSSEVDAFIEAQLGMKIPINSLRYWVLGLTHPDKSLVKLADGFEQEKWIIQYSQMQQINKQWMPRKLKALQHKTHLKLVIDRWIL
jgi:outer membrane lipoprotein LolB